MKWPLLAYVQYFKPVHSRNGIPLADADLDMYKVQRHPPRANGTRKGDIIPLSDIWQAVELSPCIEGSEADRRLTCDNSLDLPKYWHINSFSDKHIFQTVY